jgi:hypothetical protein
MILDHTIDTISPDVDGTIKIAGSLIQNTLSVTAAGTDQSTATSITADINIITSSASGSGVVLPVPLYLGQLSEIINTTSNAVIVYPAVGGTIGTGSVNAGVAIPAFSSIHYISVSLTGWYVSLTASSSGSGTTIYSGTSVVDFGAFPGSNLTSTVVTGQAPILTNSYIKAWFVASDTSSNHTANDHLYAPLFISASAGNISAGTGFTLYAVSTQRMSGQFTLRWEWY